jgi:hypothetical protein
MVPVYSREDILYAPRRYGTRVIALVIFALTFMVASASAEESSENDARTHVVVAIRMIEALSPTEPEAKSHVREVLIPDSLQDIGDKLRRLNFAQFNLISTRAQRVPLMQKEKIFLERGQTVVVRPLYVEGNRIGMWIKWKDAAGAEVLDTRMHFDSGENVIAGTENFEQGGLVLAIHVSAE